MLTLDKRAVSLMVAYVLLITIAIALSGMVYTWLKWYVGPAKEIGCDEGTTLVIQSHNYNCDNNLLEMTIRNKGRFSVDGFVVRVSDKVGSRVGVYRWYDYNHELKPEGEFIISPRDSSNYPVGTGVGSIQDKLTFMEVQSYTLDAGEIIFCDDLSAQVLSC